MNKNRKRLIEVVRESDHSGRYSLNECRITVGSASWRADWTDDTLKMEQLQDKLIDSGADPDLVREFRKSVAEESYRRRSAMSDSEYAAPPCSLLPCPFCGNQPKVTEWANGDLVTVECAGPCLLKEVTTGRYSTKERAIEAWNTRANKTAWMTEKNKPLTPAPDCAIVLNIGNKRRNK